MNFSLVRPRSRLFNFKDKLLTKWLFYDIYTPHTCHLRQCVIGGQMMSFQVKTLLLSIGIGAAAMNGLWWQSNDQSFFWGWYVIAILGVVVLAMIETEDYVGKRFLIFYKIKAGIPAVFGGAILHIMFVNFCHWHFVLALMWAIMAFIFLLIAIMVRQPRT